MGVVESVRYVLNLVLDTTKELCARLLLAFCLFFGYVFLSMIIYAAMRQFLVPQKTHVLPVYLMFSTCVDNTPERGSFVKPIEYELSSSYHKCSYPYAEFYLAGGQRLLSPGHVYSVAVEFDLPENLNNENIGMFMVNLTLYSYSGTATVSSIRPAILHYKSFLLRILTTIFYSFPLVLGLMEEKQKQVVMMLENYQEPYTEGTVFARVTVLTHQLQVYKVELTLDAVFSGLSYYLYHWPISMTVIVVSGMFFSLSAITLLMWARHLIQRLERFRHSRRHSLRMRIRASELEPIPEEDEQNRQPQPLLMDDQPVENVSISDNRTDTVETGSTISSVTEVTNSSDISELDNNLQNLKERITIEAEIAKDSTPQLLTESEDSQETEGIRQRRKT